jgi:hypothetical protein
MRNPPSSPSATLLLLLTLASPLAAQAMSSTDKGMAHDAMAMAPAGKFSGSPGHSASGTFSIGGTGNDRTLTLSEDFRVSSAPDIHVVLAKDAMARGGTLDLGALQKASGSQAFSIPASAKLDAYGAVVLWSKKNGTILGQAPLDAGGHGGMMGSDAKGMGAPAMGKDTGMMMPMAHDSMTQKP